MHFWCKCRISLDSWIAPMTVHQLQWNFSHTNRMLINDKQSDQRDHNSAQCSYGEFMILNATSGRDGVWWGLKSSRKFKLQLNSLHMHVNLRNDIKLHRKLYAFCTYPTFITTIVMHFGARQHDNDVSHAFHFAFCQAVKAIKHD